MRKYILAGMLALMGLGTAQAQNPYDVDFSLGNGLNINLEDGKHRIRLGGYVQAAGMYQEVKDLDPEYRFDVRRAYLNLSGDLQNDKFSFLLQVDFTSSYPLLDAWMAYRPSKYLTISAGQKQSFSGTRSMMFADQALALGTRSLVDRTFFKNGRELGMFFESRIPMQQMGLELGAAITTGDGANSFGANSTDFDRGGLKYSAKATLYPMGFFSPGNDLTDTDFAREKTPKLLIGGAYSYNQGASDAIGEGHGNFQLYDRYGKAAYPDYVKISADVMLKYRGLTLLGEYVNATARNLQGLRTAPSADAMLKPQQIADYLALGNGVSAQAGYLFRNNWAVDVRYSRLLPEFEQKQTLLRKADAYRLGVAKYIIDNRLKMQLAATYERYPDQAKNDRMMSVEFNTHIVF